MSTNKTSNEEISIKIKSEGIEKLIKSLKSIQGTDAAIKQLKAILGTLSAAQDIINNLANSGLASDAKKIVDIMNKTTASLSKLNLNNLAAPNLDSIRADVLSKQSKSTKGYAGNRAAGRKPLSDEAIDRIALAEFNKQNDIYANNLIKIARVIGNVNDKYEDAKSSAKLSKKNKVSTSQYDKERAKQLAQEDRELLAKQQADSKQRKKDNKEMIAHLIKEKQLRESIKNAGDISASITGASSKITGKELGFRIKEINAELKKMPANIRKVQSEKLAKDLDTAGVKTRIINGQLIVTATHGKKIESHFTKTVKEMFSMEKLLSRISFVITAKLSYELFDTLQRIPRQAFQVWRDFQDELSKTFAQMAGESSRTKDKMTADIIDLSKKYGIAAKELSTAMYEIVSSQVPIKDAAMVLEQSIKLSLAGAGDIASATKTLVQIANAYNMEFKEVARISDIAFQSVKYGQLTMQQYTEQMSKVVATASILKVPIEEVSAAVSTMTINGINADQAFTALNQMLMTIANPTERSKNLMKELGINLSISDVQTIGLGGALSKLVPILNMTGSANEELLTIMFKNRTGFKAVASILQNMPEYYENYIRMIDSAGASEAGLAERTNTVIFQQNRLKTSWESFLMLFSGGQNNSIIGFFKTLASVVEAAADNIDIVFMLLRAIVIQFGVAVFSRIVSGIGSIIVSLNSLKLALNGVAVAGTTAFAAITGGISLVISLILQAINLMYVFIKRTKEAAIDKAFGGKQIENAISRSEAMIKDFDKTLSKLNGVKSLINQWNSLNEVQDKNKQQTENLSKMYSGISRVMDSVGISIDKTGNKTENLLRYIVKVDAEITRLTNARMMADLRRQGEEARKLIRESSKQIKGSDWSAGKAWQSAETSTIDMLMSRLSGSSGEEKEKVTAQIITDMDKAVSKLFNKESQTEAKKIVTDFKATSKSPLASAQNNARILERFHQVQVNDLQLTIDRLLRFSGGKETKEIKNIQHALDMERAQLEYTQAVQGAYLDSITVPNMPEYKEVVDTDNLGGKEPSKTSFLSEATNMFESLLGDTFYETYQELQNAMLDKLQEIRDKITRAQEAGQVVTELKETEKILNDSLSLISSDSFIQMIEEAQKSIGKISDNAKSLRKSGNIAASESELRRAGNIYNSYLKMINELSGKTAEQLMSENPSLTAANAKTLVDNVSNAGAELMFFYLSQIKDAMSDEAFILEAIKQLNLSPELLTDYDALMAAIKAAEDSGQTEQLGVLKLISDTMMAEFSKMMDDLFGITSEPEFIKVLVAKVKEAAAQGGITDKDALYGITTQAIEQARESGYTISTEQAQRIRNEIIPSEKEKETAGFDIKGLLGIKDYGSGNKDITSEQLTNAAYMDMAQQTVQTLQNTWSFYWEWEINKLKEQQEKKLELLENEKKTMLANENISQEQRAVVEERFAERQKVMQEKFDKEMAAKKKKQAMFEASIAFAKGLIGIWAVELGTKGFVGALTAPILTAMLSGLFAAQMAMIANQKYAGGGYTGAGVGSPDETGYKPAGIVHEGELVVDKKTMDRNFVPMMSLYDSMRSGRSFDQAIQNYLMNGSGRVSVAPNRGLFASGGYVGKPSISNSPMVVRIDLGGARVIDNVELHKMVELGGQKRRVIGG